MIAPTAAPAVRAVAGEPLSADQQTRLHRAIWAERGRRLDVSITVSPCPYDDARLVELRRAGRAVGFLPHELSSHLTRDRFRTVFPEMDSYAESPANGFVNTADIWGWFDYETARDAPWPDLDEPATLATVAAAGRTMLTLDQYIVASQDQHLLTGHHLDDRRSWSRLATSYDGRTIAARFDGDQPEEGREDEPPTPGSLLVAYDLAPSDSGRMLGVRTRSATPPLESLWDDLWTRTTGAYVRAGYPARLGTSPADYLAGLPRIPRQPSTYAGRFAVPLVVDPRIPWQEQARLLGVRLSSQSQRFSFAAVEPAACPDVPYVGWFNAWHARFPGPISSIDARAELADDECGATPIELLAMNVALPDLVRTSRFFEAVGFVMTTPTPVRCLCLYRWRGAPELGANQHPIPYSMFRPLVRGRAITTTIPATIEERR
ncbi:hypothetical protein RB614_12040 [Phytohabitans sp. ZYX-F-186]|uniref:Uncharacterized protein n=1 Tax=Phytohabitans maris TaxID=3071409 RepID=A0ABU0ZG54_9ACTN|nr:hypothetical protein [Phytohabitans sp. ZYX-F-186]MDQ7905255.1 hypothetical protein [Phytohabitans sp. ZYX-F-186]